MWGGRSAGRARRGDCRALSVAYRAQESVEGVYLGLFPPVTRLVIETADAESCSPSSRVKSSRWKISATGQTLRSRCIRRPSHSVSLTRHDRGRCFPGGTAFRPLARRDRTAGTTPRRQLRQRVITTLASSNWEKHSPAPTPRSRPPARPDLPDEAGESIPARYLTRPRPNGRRQRASDALERLDAAAGYARSLNTDLELALHLPPDSEVSLTPLAGVPLAFSSSPTIGPRLQVSLLPGCGSELEISETTAQSVVAQTPSSPTSTASGPTHGRWTWCAIRSTRRCTRLTMRPSWKRLPFSASQWNRHIRSSGEGRPIAVTPVTLRMRSNPRCTKPATSARRCPCL